MGVGLYLRRHRRHSRSITGSFNGIATPHVQSLRIPRQRGFLLIVRTGRIVTDHENNHEVGVLMDKYRRILGYSSIWWGFPTAKLKLHRYSYGRRLPGLRFRALPRKANPSP